MRKGLMCALALSLLLSGLGPRAAGVRKVSLEECAAKADSVFVGTVVDIQARWGEGGKLIWTDYTFRVQEGWKGAPGDGLRVVSVGGGAIGDRAFQLSEVPSFEMGGTYVVYAYDNARLYAEAVVGVEQGLFREVADARTGKKFLVDAGGYRMEKLADGCIVRGRLTQRVGDTQTAHVLTDEELVAQQEAFEREAGPATIPPPVVRDAAGNIVPTRADAPKTARQRAQEQVRLHPAGEPVTREMLREFTLHALGLTGPAGPSPLAGTEERGKP